MEFLKCDAPGCDHRHDVEQITDEMVGMLCPKCGANLLTVEDYDHYVKVFRPAMRAMTELGLVQPATAGSDPSQVMSVNYHDGELRLRFPKVEKGPGE